MRTENLQASLLWHILFETPEGEVLQLVLYFSDKCCIQKQLMDKRVYLAQKS